MKFTIETEQEIDSRWIAEVLEIAGVLVYGKTKAEAIARAKALALHTLAEQLEHGEENPFLELIAFEAVASCAYGLQPKHVVSWQHSCVSGGRSNEQQDYIEP